MRRPNVPVWLPPAARVVSGIVLLLGRTWRYRYAEGYDALDREFFQAGRRVIFAFWHARLFPLIYSHRGRGIAVLSSRHRDGEWMAQVIQRLGFVTARGSSTRGGSVALRGLIDLAAAGHLPAITPDGPRGPAERAKPGIVYLAGRLGWPVVPVATAANANWRFRSWDRFRVPHPFARVHVAYGEPMSIPPDLDAEAEAAWTARIEAAIDALTRAADAAVGSGR